MTAAGAAALGLGARSRAFAAAGIAGLAALDLQHPLGPGLDLEEADRDLGLQARSRSRAAAPATPAAEDVEDVAERAEDVIDGLEAGAATATLHSGVAELVVAGSAGRVRENLVGLGGFLELPLGIVVPGVLVGVMLEGQLAVGLLDVLFPGIAVDPQNLVVVAFVAHGGSPR